ncbi:MAG: hypothetical protein A3H31_01165 [Gallionellales bacterium RIFCSPLOWO2_02_FULL_57_47]|nr:MAG: hypothetical protein A3H31_01165 [Gallionellales bacterium RIFCSPLOWO2_02_FULL_57_47]OGT13526.1 MAG: hypothetical protein A3J49_11870 [Gallionellales bacterium RIFCSPHIGHO2_02_FULL_57_16]
MADAGAPAARILLVMKAGGLILIRSRLEVLRCHSVMQLMLVLLDSDSMAIAAHRLHSNRNSQRVAAEQRQPDGYKYRNKFFNGTRHVCSLAKFGNPVKCKIRLFRPDATNKVRFSSGNKPGALRCPQSMVKLILLAPGFHRLKTVVHGVTL